MDLQEHVGWQLRLSKLAIERDHRHLDHVGCGTLDYRIDRHSLGLEQLLFLVFVERLKVPNSLEDPFSARKGRDESFGSAIDQGVGDELAYVRVFGEVLIDELPSIGTRDTQRLGEPKWALAIKDTEAYRLGVSSHARGDLVDRYAMDLCRDGRMDIDVVFKSHAQVGIRAAVG